MLSVPWADAGARAGRPPAAQSGDTELGHRHTERLAAVVGGIFGSCWAAVSVAKAQRLSSHFGFDTVVTKPMTISEIANQHEATQQEEHIEITGFHKRAPPANE